MNIEKRYTQIPEDSWAAISQKMELDIWKNTIASEDRNAWWLKKFNYYSNLKNETVNTIFEAGCGPFAKNIQYIMQVLKSTPKRIYLNDPLLDEYLKMEKPVKSFVDKNNVICYSTPLEKCSLPETVDMIIVINVLDHVYDIDLCFKSIYNNLNKNGLLILGNDLTNEENFKETPKDDPYGMLHPIRFDYEDIKGYLNLYDPVFIRISEPMGSYHCGTLSFIGRKT